MKKNVEFARKLRKEQTPQESKFWSIVRNHKFYSLEFRRQYPMGDYIVDFICREKKIIIELDGGQHNELENVEYDIQRSIYLEKRGYKVIRFWNNDIDDNIEGVYEILKNSCNIHPPP